MCVAIDVHVRVCIHIHACAVLYTCVHCTDTRVVPRHVESSARRCGPVSFPCLAWDESLPGSGPEFHVCAKGHQELSERKDEETDGGRREEKTGKREQK